MRRESKGDKKGIKAKIQEPTERFLNFSFMPGGRGMEGGKGIWGEERGWRGEKGYGERKGDRGEKGYGEKKRGRAGHRVFR